MSAGAGLTALRDLAPPALPPLTRIAVRGTGRIALVPAAAIVRLEAEDNYVRIWADRPYLHKSTLTALVARLDPAKFARIHRRHAVNIDCARELRPLPHGEFAIVLVDGTELTTGRSYTRDVRQAFGLV